MNLVIVTRESSLISTFLVVRLLLLFSSMYFIHVQSDWYLETDQKVIKK